MNWGGFADGFSRGFGNGIYIGKTIEGARKQKELDDVRAQGIAEARAAQEKAVAASVRETGVDNATPATAPNASAPEAPAVQTAPVPAPEKPTPLPMAPDMTTATPAASGIQTPASVAQSTPAQAAPALIDPPRPATMPSDPATTGSQQPATEMPATPAANGIGVAEKPKRFTVEGKGFATREEAVEEAKRLHRLSNFSAKTIAEKMEQYHIENGNLEEADRWSKWYKSKDGERKLERWADAYKAYQQGDFVTAAQHLVRLHKDMPDGNTITAAEPVKDKDGNITGFNMKLKNDATGEERAQFVDPKSLTEYGLGALSPDKMFSAIYQRQAEADKLAAQGRLQAQKDAATFSRQMAVEKYRGDRQDSREAAKDNRSATRDERLHGYKLDEMVTADQLKAMGAGRDERAKIQTKIDILKENGISPDVVRELVPHMVGGDGYKKGASPEEAQRMMLTDLLSKDTLLPTMTKPEDREKRVNLLKQNVDQAMKAIYGTGKDAPNPADTAAPPGLKDGVYRDSKTGEVFRVQGGKKVGMQQNAPPVIP
jgi:hypothetical protein